MEYITVAVRDRTSYDRWPVFGIPPAVRNIFIATRRHAT
jgi:hypothetical protein